MSMPPAPWRAESRTCLSCHTPFRPNQKRQQFCSPACAVKRPVPGRFWSKVDRRGLFDCWPWLATVCMGARYGGFSVDGRMRPAHRVAYELLVGPIPVGLELDHLCRNTLCVNPAHLEPVTHRVNALRGVGFAAQNARKTECVRGHGGLSPTRWGRVCRTCSAERNRAYRLRKKAAA